MACYYTVEELETLGVPFDPDFIQEVDGKKVLSTEDLYINIGLEISKLNFLLERLLTEEDCMEIPEQSVVSLLFSSAKILNPGDDTPE